MKYKNLTIIALSALFGVNSCLAEVINGPSIENSGNMLIKGVMAKTADSDDTFYYALSGDYGAIPTGCNIWVVSNDHNVNTLLMMAYMTDTTVKIGVISNGNEGHCIIATAETVD